MDAKQKKELKAAAHHLKPVIRIGQKGMSDNLIAETNLALEKHELIKVHIQQGEREERLALAEQLANTTHAELVHQIGKTFILYRSNPPKE